MNTTTFDYRMQTLTCPSCGAPLVTSKDGGLVRCTYCSTTSVVNPRKAAPGAGCRSSLAEETARFSRLKAQLEHPMVGHFYDLTRPPSGFEQWTPSGAAGVERLLGEWSSAIHAPLGARAETQRRVCWMALQVANGPSTPDLLRIRALLETTLGWLEDEGYRHFIRCRLAQAALEENDLDAAEGWIAECDLAPEILELDSASRLVRAWLACRRRRADDVLELLGDEGAHLPIAAYQEDEAERLRVDALETLNRMEAACRGFHLLARQNGLVAECERFARYDLAPRTIRAAFCGWLAEITQQRIVSLRTKIAELAKRREEHTALSATRPLRMLPIHAMVLAFATLLVQCSYDTDPLGGTYGYVLCPKVCTECQGPTRTATQWNSTGPGEWSTNGPQYFCQSPHRRVTEMSARELKTEARSLSGQELAPMSAFFGTYAILLVILLPFGVIQSLRRASRNRVRFHALSFELSELALELGEAAPQPPSHLRDSLRGSALILGVAGLTALMLAWWIA